MNERNSPLFNFNELFIWCLFLAFTGLRDAWNKWRQFWCVKRSLKWFNFYLFRRACFILWRMRNEIYCGEILFLNLSPYYHFWLARSINYWILCIFSSRLAQKDNRERFRGSMNFSVSITTITSFIKRQQIFPLLFIVIIVINLNDYNLFTQIIPPCFH